MNIAPLLKQEDPFRFLYATKLSEILEISLEDVAAAEACDAIDIDMSYYVATGDDLASCVVCQAGAVLMRRFHHQTVKALALVEDDEDDWTPLKEAIMDDFDPDLRRRLQAINSLRMGDVCEAAAYFGIGEGEHESLSRSMPQHVGPARYDPDKHNAWWAAQRQLLADLKAAGL